MLNFSANVNNILLGLFVLFVYKIMTLTFEKKKKITNLF